MKGDLRRHGLPGGRVILLFPLLLFLGGCAIGGCPISPHLNARAEPPLTGGGKTPLVLDSAHYTIPPVETHTLPNAFGCPVVPPDLVHHKERAGR